MELSETSNETLYKVGTIKKAWSPVIISSNERSHTYVFVQNRILNAEQPVMPNTTATNKWQRHVDVAAQAVGEHS